MRVRDTRHLAQTIDGLRRSGKVTGTKTLMILDTWEPVGGEHRATRLGGRYKAR